MSNKEYSEEQIGILKVNKYVRNCSSKYITFTDELKIEALKMDKEWIYFRDIFRYFSFPDFIVNSEVPRDIIKEWKKKLKNKWLPWLVGTKKWRKKWEKIDISKMTLEEKIEYLETENAYLKELHKVVYWHYP